MALTFNSYISKIQFANMVYIIDGHALSDSVDVLLIIKFIQTQYRQVSIYCNL